MRLAFVGILFLSIAAVCDAAPVTYTYEGIASGQIGSTVFDMKPFIITGIADSQNRTRGQGVYTIVHDSTTIQLEGLGTFDISSRLMSFVNRRFAVAGLSYVNRVLINQLHNDDFAHWGLINSIGPITDPADIIQWDVFDIMTSGGVLELYDGPTTVTFTAFSLVPEPSSLCLCIGSIVLLGIRRRG